MEESTGRFSIGEKVLVPHTDKFYEAKILKAEFRDDGQWYYFLHYTGWNKKYDEWVEELGLTKCAQAEQPGTAPVSTAAAAAPIAGTTGTTAPGQATAGATALQPKKRAAPKDKFLKKRALADIMAPEAGGVHLDMEIPPIIKKHLLEDYDAVTEDGRLIPLPRNPSVAGLLQQYVQEMHELRGTSENEEELAAGLRTYFDKALEVMLLYRSERQVALQVLSDGRVPSSVYGAEHLARLFIKLPELLSITEVTEDQLANIAVMVQDLMNWMSEKATSLFLPREAYTAPEVE